MDERFGIVRYDRWDRKTYVFCPYCGAKEALADKGKSGIRVSCDWCNKIYIMPLEP